MPMSIMEMLFAQMLKVEKMLHAVFTLVLERSRCASSWSST